MITFPVINFLRPRSSKKRLALVFYATDDTYAVSVLVFVRLLRELGMRHDADVVVLHLPLAPAIMEKTKEMGITTRLVQALHMVRKSHYRHCLLKLRILELVEYDRVVFADADALPLKSLDYLFSLPIRAPIAAASAYWIPQPFLTTALMVVQPSIESWDRVQKHFAAAYDKDYYDMDIVNCEFVSDIGTLPLHTFCLNTEWEDKSRPGFFADQSTAYSSVSVVHFTALGKPWQYSTDEAKLLRPNAHPAFYDMWDKWRSTRKTIFR